MDRVPNNISLSAEASSVVFVAGFCFIKCTIIIVIQAHDSHI